MSNAETEYVKTISQIHNQLLALLLTRVYEEENGKEAKAEGVVLECLTGVVGVIGPGPIVLSSLIILQFSSDKC